MNGGRFLLPVVLSATFVQLLNATIAQTAAPAARQGVLLVFVFNAGCPRSPICCSCTCSPPSGTRRYPRR
ncbi:hypothetical protein [Streptomyces antimycoticus]|uniref:hypothetical protein n=1 Tax=Streptomyces antimycoticus TaxID=68175 RepID=UPI001D158E0A|nr:hypothetical protein [Streptomyces antimycoticus]